MKLLVTGGAGFIGSNFIKYWLQNHPTDKIINFDKLTYAGNLENLSDLENNPNYAFVQGDICDAETVLKNMEGVDIVVHFAAESHVDRSIMEPAAFVMTNIVGTQVLLDAALKNNIKKFHHVSTDEVFGHLSLDDQEKFNENTPYDPRSPYSASKASSDHLVRAYHKTYGLPITITNCSNNFGPYQFPEKIIPLAITNVLEGKKIPIYGDGLYVRDWLYVEDHCRAIDAVLENGKTGETYCVGGLTQDINNLEVAKKIIKILGKDENMIFFVKDRPGHDRRYAIDWSKIKKELSWEPLHSFDEWLESTVNWYKKNEAWWKRVKSGEYKNYYKKQYGRN
ncbi:MAG: dTDP-glucose 4,6-dehydratase, dTDP-glucose 4,6-dehydratase [Microgenomates group bacterium GW2011_GWC1_38_14]|nr:MAG: dTDP-glucose 4,6-dehydratase, dTDP-glucose 4,6-dehydratase [Microgenomates group bacterium GW2011_GWC1_38_14]OGH43811.1 MAG: dTDP-glucose 4,6-dehydratase [Candidatus Levybacteria bacterium RIFCSPLOWO2_02_FULL_37_11]